MCLIGAFKVPPLTIFVAMVTIKMVFSYWLKLPCLFLALASRFTPYLFALCCSSLSVEVTVAAVTRMGSAVGTLMVVCPLRSGSQLGSLGSVATHLSREWVRVASTYFTIDQQC